MFLTRIELTAEKLQQIQEYTNDVDAHDWREQRLHGEFQTSVPRQYFWKFERMDGNWYLYMVNDVAPKGAELGPNSMASSLVAKAKENLLSSLLVDQPMAFQITANLPSAEASDTHGKLDTQVIVAQQRQCLLKLQTKYGFQILKQVSVSSAKDENDYVYELINQDQPIFGHLQNGHIRTDCVTFAGDLVIKNLLSFEKMLLNGMEGGKDADFGLLTLTPTM